VCSLAPLYTTAVLTALAMRGLAKLQGDDSACGRRPWCPTSCPTEFSFLSQCGRGRVRDGEGCFIRDINNRIGLVTTPSFRFSYCVKSRIL
jgi:hypothetical protein